MRARRGASRERSFACGASTWIDTRYKRSAFLGSELTDFDIIAREVSGYRTRFEAIEKRLDEVERVNARLEELH